MTTFHKRALLVLAVLLLVLFAVLLFGWQITLVLSVILSIGLSIPLSTLWQGLGRSPQVETRYQERREYEQGLQPMVYYYPSDTANQPKEERVTEDIPMAQYPQQIQ